MKLRLAWIVLMIGMASGCVQLSEAAIPLRGGPSGARYGHGRPLRRRSGHDSATALEIKGLLQQGPAFLERRTYRVKIIGQPANAWPRKTYGSEIGTGGYYGRGGANHPILSASSLRRL